MATISCQDCGAERTQTPKNTKFCKPCRLLRDIDYWITRFKSCRGCGEAFAPLNRPDNLCSSCDPGMITRPVDCALCQKTGRTLIFGIPVCAACLRDPKRRKSLYDALIRGQTNRKRSNDATTQQP